MNGLVLIRIFIGLIFIVSGAEKLAGHYQNFLYVIQGYQLISSPLDEWVARFFPWMELVLGIFGVLGLWTRWALRGILLFTTMFLVVVGQAVLRDLPVGECGCFGGLISIPLPRILLMDSLLWIYTAYLIIRFERTLRCSLDEYFSEEE